MTSGRCLESPARLDRRGFGCARINLVRVRRFRLWCLRAATLCPLIAVVAIGGRSAQGGDAKLAVACRMETRLNPGGPALFETTYFVDDKGRLMRAESRKGVE